MNWHDLWAAVALMLIFEGLLPFISPEKMRKTLLLMSQLNDGKLRFVGLTSMIIGLLILYLSH